MKNFSVGSLTVVLLLATGCAKHASAPQFRPQLAGKWELNTAESTALLAADSGRAEPRSGRRGGIGGGFGGMGGRGGFGRGGRGMPGEMGQGRRGDPAEMRELVQSLVRRAASLRISEDDSTVTIVYADSMSVRLQVDGKKRKQTLRGFGEVETKARWQEGALELERKFEGELTVKEVFTRAPDSPRLVVTTRVKGTLLGERTARRVYELQKG